MPTDARIFSQPLSALQQKGLRALRPSKLFRKYSTNKLRQIAEVRWTGRQLNSPPMTNTLRLRKNRIWSASSNIINHRVVVGVYVATDTASNQPEWGIAPMAINTACLDNLVGNRGFVDSHTFCGSCWRCYSDCNRVLSGIAAVIRHLEGHYRRSIWKR